MKLGKLGARDLPRRADLWLARFVLVVCGVRFAAEMLPEVAAWGGGG